MVGMKIMDFSNIRIFAIYRSALAAMILFAASATWSTAQSVDIFSEADLANAAGITDIEGNLVIWETTAANLDALSSLNRVTGDLIIYENDSLLNIDGLSNLLSVDGSVVIIYNDQLLNASGLQSLMIVSNLYIEGNLSLKNLDGLSGLIDVSGDLSIVGNTSLEEFCGLHSLLSLKSSVEGSVIISENASNPTVEDILSGCSTQIPDEEEEEFPDEAEDPDAILQEWLDSGILNAGQANALQKIIHQAPRKALTNKLRSSVKSGQLTEEQAERLILALENAATE